MGQRKTQVGQWKSHIIITLLFLGLFSTIIFWKTSSLQTCKSKVSLSSLPSAISFLFSLTVSTNQERERERDQSAPIVFEKLILRLENGEEFSDRTWKEKKMGFIEVMS